MQPNQNVQQSLHNTCIVELALVDLFLAQVALHKMCEAKKWRYILCTDASEPVHWLPVEIISVCSPCLEIHLGGRQRFPFHAVWNLQGPKVTEQKINI